MYVVEYDCREAFGKLIEILRAGNGNIICGFNTMNYRELPAREPGCDVINDVDWGRTGLGCCCVRPNELVDRIKGLCEGSYSRRVGDA